MKRVVAFAIVSVVASLVTVRAGVTRAPVGIDRGQNQSQAQNQNPATPQTQTPPQTQTQTQNQNQTPTTAPAAPQSPAVAQYNGTIGGEPPIILTRPRSLNANQPQFLQATFLPGAGMNLFALKAYIPGRGDVDLIATTDLATAAPLLESSAQPGNSTLTMGAPFFAPFAGLLRGTLSPDGKTIGAVIDGHRLWFQANWHGPESGAEAGAANGLILGSKFQVVSQHNGPDESTVFTTLHAGNFGGQWLSNTDLTIGATLHDTSLGLYVMAKNAGDQEDPIGIGFLPYFVIPSGDRKQARLTIPGDMRALVNNHQDDFPTGRIVSVDGTAYDFTSPNGTALGNFSLDDCFTDIQQAENDDNQGSSVNNNQIIQLIDPAAKYGLRIRILSQHIKAIQVYAPADKNFVAIGPQFNLSDPYARVWRGQDTGMVPLEEGKSAVWYIRLELFTPR